MQCSVEATHNACTLEFFTSRSHIHTTPLTPMVLSMMISAGNPLGLTVSKRTRSMSTRLQTKAHLQLDNFMGW